MLCYLPTLAPSPDRYGTFTGPRTDSLPPSLSPLLCACAFVLVSLPSSSIVCSLSPPVYPVHELAGWLAIYLFPNPNLPLLRSLACFAISISALFFSFPRLRAKHPLAPSSLPPIPINQPSFPPTNELFVCVCVCVCVCLVCSSSSSSSSSSSFVVCSTVTCAIPTPCSGNEDCLFKERARARLAMGLGALHAHTPPVHYWRMETL